MNKFWNVRAGGGKASLDLFGYVGGSKDDPWGRGFNESEFLDDFRKIPSDSALDISINSFGGAVYTGLSIYSLLKAHKGPITFRVDGAAMSAATIITSVPGAKVIMPRGSMMMIHKVSSVAIGTTDDMRKVADDMEKLEENLIDIYVEKTGRTADEIKEKVNAETFFTAEEAVEFGLADEIDETTEVKNTASGGFVMLNGLKAESRFFANVPKGFIKADTSQASAIKKEGPKMDLDTLKAEHPDLVQAIRNEALAEGAAQERERIQAIEDIAIVGHENLVNAAKFDGKTTAEALAVQILKADKARGAQMLKARANDAKALEGIEAEGNEGLNPKAEEKAKQDAEMKAVIEAGARAFARK
jgi:ATP-dependent protease ClpP protease subunit